MSLHRTPARVLLLLVGGAVCLIAVAAPRPAGAPAASPAPGSQLARPSDQAAFASAKSVAVAPITARAVEISETRERRLVSAAGPHAGFFTGLKIKLRLEGPAAASATKAGRLTVAEASDDVGTDLRDPEQLKWCVQLQDVNRFTQSESDKAAGAFEYEVRLGLPPRKATSLKRLRAELTVLAGGEERIVSIPAARKLAGKQVEDPALKAAGMVLKILPSPDGKKDGIRVEFSGDSDVIKEVKVLTPDGTNVLSGTWWTDATNRRNVTYMLSRGVEDDEARLELRVAVGQKKLIVPVDLADLPLP